MPNTPSANCLVKVSILDAGGTVLDEDSSDAVFEIQTPPPTVLVTLPDGGESWQVGSLHNITWTSTNSTTDSISYSVDNGASWLFVAKAEPADAHLRLDRA